MINEFKQFQWNEMYKKKEKIPNASIYFILNTVECIVYKNILFWVKNDIVSCAEKIVFKIISKKLENKIVTFSSHRVFYFIIFVLKNFFLYVFLRNLDFPPFFYI